MLNNKENALSMLVGSLTLLLVFLTIGLLMGGLREVILVALGVGTMAMSGTVMQAVGYLIAHSSTEGEE